MKLAALLCAVVFPAHADYISGTLGGDYVRISEQACPADILSMVSEDIHDRLHAAEVRISGTVWRACWAVTPDGTVHILFEDGDSGKLPVGQFRKVTTL